MPTTPVTIRMTDDLRLELDALVAELDAQLARQLGRPTPHGYSRSSAIQYAVIVTLERLRAEAQARSDAQQRLDAA